MSNNQPIIPCQLSDKSRQIVDDYALELRERAHEIGAHGLSEEEFRRAGIFESAVERLRGQRAASTQVKQQFVAKILMHLEERGQISSWEFKGSSERFDYEVKLPNDRIAIIETKGCLDGNNTNIFVRPPHADEFIVWSLCQNAASDPQHNAWSGIHTRLSAEIVSQRQQVDSVIIWDMLCGTIGRPCPKLLADPERAIEVQDISVPPPCIYLFPRSIPDPRNNQTPPVWKSSELPFVGALAETFGCRGNDIVNVGIETRMNGPDIERRTVYDRHGERIRESRWTKIKRSR